MQYIDEYRDHRLVDGLVGAIHRAVNPAQRYRLMEFCGGHTHALFRFGIVDLLPKNVELIHGPGCPVCVLPTARLDQAIYLAQRPEVILCSYGDMLRVPGSDKMTLQKARAAGGDVRMVYSVQDALRLAEENPAKQVVFFAIGFETTTPPTALAILQARSCALTNFFVFCNHLLTPAALYALLQAEAAEFAIDGFIGPAHVSTVIGSDAYRFVSQEYGKPIVIAGFEPVDMLQAIWMLVTQLNEGRAEVENEYARAVSAQGNRKAQAVVADVFTTRDEFEWRGLGRLPQSALAIRSAFSQFDAERQFALPDFITKETKACECPAILRGAKKPRDCAIFATVCTPENPVGACMVSAEGACAAYYRYRGAQHE